MSLLEARAVSRRFGGVTALARVDLGVTRGEVVGLIGPNGAGKTTFFGVVSGFVAPDEGSVRFDGHEVVGLAPHEICRLGLTRTFQLVQPFAGLTVIENVMVGAFVRVRAPLAARAIAREVLSRTRLTALAERPAHTLPIALRKRLEVARALATRPRLLLLDEVMAGLNPREVAETVELLRRIRGAGVTLLVIEHVMTAVMDLCDRIAVLHHGELIASGTPAEIGRDARVIDAYLGTTAV